MAPSEFEIIKQYFDKPLPESDRKDVVYGIGDDCAIISSRPGFELVVSMDTLVSGVHFPASADPYDIACRALAVNVSDLSAMGASPGWFTLALTLPEANPRWLASFSEGLLKSAKQCSMPLVGGDTTRGPLSITIQVHGYVPSGQALRRDGAKVDDDIYVTGWLGQAGAWLALSDHQKTQDKLLYEHFYRPPSRLDLAIALREFASAAIDISDGLLADLSHVLEKSKVGASILLEHIPYSDNVSKVLGKERAIDLALSAGDDYELCFTAPQRHAESIASLSQAYGLPITCIGRICTGGKLTLLNEKGHPVVFARQGYQHF